VIALRGFLLGDSFLGDLVPVISAGDTYIICQGCCTMEYGHWVLFFIVMQFFMNLEDNSTKC